MINKETIKDIKKDGELFYAYQANIAMSFKDEVSRYKKKTGKKNLSNKDIHIISNNAATNFLELLFRQTRNNEIDKILEYDNKEKFNI